MYHVSRFDCVTTYHVIVVPAADIVYRRVVDVVMPSVTEAVLEASTLPAPITLNAKQAVVRQVIAHGSCCLQASGRNPHTRCDRSSSEGESGRLAPPAAVTIHGDAVGLGGEFAVAASGQLL